MRLFLPAVVVLGTDAETSEAYGRIRSERAVAGQPIPKTTSGLLPLRYNTGSRLPHVISIRQNRRHRGSVLLSVAAFETSLSGKSAARAARIVNITTGTGAPCVHAAIERLWSHRDLAGRPQEQRIHVSFVNDPAIIGQYSPTMSRHLAEADAAFSNVVPRYRRTCHDGVIRATIWRWKNYSGAVVIAERRAESARTTSRSLHRSRLAPGRDSNRVGTAERGKLVSPNENPAGSIGGVSETNG